MWDRKAGKVSKPFLFNIGLLCSKTFDDAIFPELFEAKYGLKKADMVKMNIKGVFQIWMKDGSYHEIDLKECHAWTRQGCKSCPDFAAEHSDIATGGIGEDNDWTLTIVRTELGEEVISRMIADGVDHRPPRAGGREGDEAAAPALDRQPPPLAGVRRRRPQDRRAPAQEEGPRPGPGRRAGQRCGCPAGHRCGWAGTRPGRLASTRAGLLISGGAPYGRVYPAAAPAASGRATSTHPPSRAERCVASTTSAAASPSANDGATADCPAAMAVRARDTPIVNVSR